MIGKLAIPRDEKHLDLIRRKCCAVDGCGRVSEPHHALGRRGTGVKPSDFGAVNLCHDHHMECHAMGVTSFQAKHDLDFKELALNLIHESVTGQGLTMVIE